MLTHIDPRPHFRDLDVELAIEAATEHLATKLDLFRALDANTPPRGDPRLEHEFDLHHQVRRETGSRIA